MIVRFERWGAWVKLESMAALVALDRQGVRQLGLDGGEVWEDPAHGSHESVDARESKTSPALADSLRAPLEVHLAVTARCGAGCRGCYIDAQPGGFEPPREQLESALDAMRDAGVFTVAFGGGEPTTRDDLESLAEAARQRGITPVVTTSGLGLSDARIARLRAFAQVNVSYDGLSATYASVRGFDGATPAEHAIERLARAGVRVGINVVLTRESYPRLHETLTRARSLGASEAQLLRYKPAGRAMSLDYAAQRLTGDQGRALGSTLRGLAADFAGEPPFRLRIDCALVPFLSADDVLGRDPALLVRFGVFGCEAGNALAAVTVDGRVAPCSFATPTALSDHDLADGFARDRTLETWRAFSHNPPEPCRSCALRAVCKGGCKVVAAFSGQAHRPDPECPRVLAHGRDPARMSQDTP